MKYWEIIADNLSKAELELGLRNSDCRVRGIRQELIGYLFRRYVVQCVDGLAPSSIASGPY